MDPSLAVKVESGGTLNYNIFKGAPGGNPWDPPGKVPAKGRHASDRPARPTQARHRRKPCLFCNDVNHVSARCDRYATIEARKERLRALDRCQRCVAERGKQAHDCVKKKRPCYHCKDARHHKVLCPKYLQEKVPAENKLYKKQARPEKVMALQRDQEQSEVDSCVSSDSDYNDTEDDASSGDEYDRPTSGAVHAVTVADHTVMHASSCDRTLLMTTVVDVSNPEAHHQRYSCPVFFRPRLYHDADDQGPRTQAKPSKQGRQGRHLPRLW